MDNTAIENALNTRWDWVQESLSKKIALRAVSSEGISGDHMRASAEFVAQCLKDVGVDASVVQAKLPDGKPGAFEVIGHRTVDPTKPTVLLYAHHDVQPVPDASKWKTEPFKGTVVDGRLYGRGSSDDGGGIFIHVGALAALGDELGVNVKFYIEGEEEMGSPCFTGLLDEHPEYFDADVLMITDSSNWSTTIPSLTSSLRGNVVVDVDVKVLDHPVHSGSFGGPILDSVTTSALIVASLYDKDGNVAIEGIKGAEPVGGLKQDIDPETFKQDSTVVPGYTFAGTDTLAARLWTKPCISVIGIDATDVEHSFNVLSNHTRFRLSMRTCPLQPAQEAAQALKKHIESHAPFGAQVTVTVGEVGPGWAMDANSSTTQIMEGALTDAFGVEPLNEGQGGSIPMVAHLQERFPKAKILVDGPEDPKTNAHSPNESQDLELLRKSIVAEAILLQRIGENLK